MTSRCSTNRNVEISRPQEFVSAYASVHPWEDWAETWAHYLHLSDAMETAGVCGLFLQPARPNVPAMQRPPLEQSAQTPFDQLINDWFALIYALNNLNRSMGLPDAYPFVLSEPAIQKLRFVHEIIRQRHEANSTQSAEMPTSTKSEV